jgi:AbrB family looped-hinge helix DNA binding protein
MRLPAATTAMVLAARRTPPDHHPPGVADHAPVSPASVPRALRDDGPSQSIRPLCETGWSESGRLGGALLTWSQITLPKAVRDALGLHEGDQVVFRVEGDRAVLARIPELLDLAGTVSVPAGKRGAPGTRFAGRSVPRGRATG